MKFTAFALAAAVTSVSSANFVSYVVTKTSTTNSGVALDVYTLWARFDGPTDTILNAFNFNRVDGSAGNMFYHKDNASYNSGVLQQEFGTWNPSQTGNAAANRPFDSYLTIGNQAVGTNPTQADPSWPIAGGGWDRPDLADNGTIGWFNPNPPNNQGRVGVGANTATDVRLGQFVLSANDSAARNYSLTIGYNSGVAGAPVQFGDGSFSLPAPGALALLGLAGFAGRRRR